MYVGITLTVYSEFSLSYNTLSIPTFGARNTGIVRLFFCVVSGSCDTVVEFHWEFCREVFNIDASSKIKDCHTRLGNEGIRSVGGSKQTILT